MLVKLKAIFLFGKEVLAKLILKNSRITRLTLCVPDFK